LAAVALGSGAVVGVAGCSSDPDPGAADAGAADAAADNLVIGLPVQEAGPPARDAGPDTRDGLPAFDAGIDASEAGSVDAGVSVDSGGD
jgi:hypothetical protein